jgi:two-component system sensor histidine kinase YesM
MKLQKKFAFIFISISVIPILIFSVYTYNRYAGLVNQQTMQTAKNLMNVSAAQANHSLQSLQQMVETMYLTKEDNSSMVDDLKKYLPQSNYSKHDIFQSNQKLRYTCQDFIYFSDDINGIFIFTPDGPILGYGYGNGSNVISDYSPLEDSWYQNTLSLKGGTYIYGPCAKDFIEGNRSSIAFCNALYDVYTREFLGVLFIDCDPEIFDLSNVNSLPDSAVLSVKNGKNTLYSTVPLPPGEFSTDIIELQQTLDLGSLSLNISVSQRSLSKEFGITQITLLALAATCIIGVFILSLFLSRKIISPIIYLSSKMLKKNEDACVSDAPYFHYEDEIGTLYNSYQEMLDERQYYIKHELENKLIILDAQMRALESQVNAHFLYNTLESINSIALAEKVPRISIMSLALGRMFRYSIKTQSELVPLAAELKNVQDYVSIQQIRFDHGFHLDVHIPESLLNLKVLKLILQPLVENALYHGLDNCQAGDRIILSAFTKDSTLLLTVSDNGIGIPEERLLQLQKHLKQKAEFTELGKRRHSSIGISNINTRIALYYGDNYGLQISSKTGKGTTVCISVPILS